jgi:predicted transcriptional regulator of viral defense system
MLQSTELIIDQKLGHHIIRDYDLAHIFKGTPARRYGLVNKAIKKGELVRLCRGYYTLSSKYMKHPLSAAYIANRLTPNSFVSAESALSFHDWIPERITQTISICASGRNKVFQTPVGDFLYYKSSIEAACFFFGVELQESFSQLIYIASPLRALIDFVYLHKINNANTSFLIESLRIDERYVFSIKEDDIKSLISVYKASNVNQFLQNLLHEIYHE